MYEILNFGMGIGLVLGYMWIENNQKYLGSNLVLLRPAVPK